MSAGGMFWIGFAFGVLGLPLLIGGILTILDRRRMRRTDAALRAAAPATRSEIQLSPADVPDELVGALPMAMAFGIGCDVARPRRVETATAAERAELVAVMRRHGPAIHQWMHGTRAVGSPEWLVPFEYALEAAELADPAVDFES